MLGESLLNSLKNKTFSECTTIRQKGCITEIFTSLALMKDSLLKKIHIHFSHLWLLQITYEHNAKQPFQKVDALT